MFGKKDHLVGLDIGSRSIKAAEVIKTNRGYRLKKFGIIDIAADAIQEGEIKDPEAVAGSIRKLFKQAKFKEKNVATSIGGYSVIVKKINVQRMPEDQLQKTIQFEAEQYIPFDINDVNLDFQILEQSESNPNQMSVLLIAAKQDMINSYVDLIQMAGLHPSIIDVDAFSLQNIFELNYSIKTGNVALVDIGASKTSLNVIRGASSEFIRDIPLGCDQINQQIISHLDCSSEESEKLKFGKHPDKISPEDLKGIVSAVVADWCTEIRHAFDFFYSTYPDDQLSKIFLSGGGANIKEFHQLLADEASVEVETVDPFKNLLVNHRQLSASYLGQIAPQAAICLGLAIRRVDDK